MPEPRSHSLDCSAAPNAPSAHGDEPVPATSVPRAAGSPDAKLPEVTERVSRTAAPAVGDSEERHRRIRLATRLLATGMLRVARQDGRLDGAPRRTRGGAVLAGKGQGPSGPAGGKGRPA